MAPIELPDADCLLVVPPLAHLAWPALGVHVLQACAREAGFEVGVLYMNVLYAAAVGTDTYVELSDAPSSWLLGDHLFARAAFGCPPLGFDADGFLARIAPERQDGPGLWALEAQALALSERVAQAIAARGYAVVGATSTFDQTTASLALLSRVKALNPATRTIIGGANCEGPMARGIRSVARVDHVFSGESERVFVDFLRDRDAAGPIVEGAPCTDLDALPTPRFDAFFEQVGRLDDLGDLPLWLTYETSRGCWWGAKHHCTFCGLNGMGMGFRHKSPDRVIEELNTLLASAPTRSVCMTDNIMPFSYHDALIPRLRAEVGEVHLFYEQKANLTLARVRALWEAGVRNIQPGIEALDSELLQLVDKGVFARQNVALLRYARSVGMAVQWNLLWGLPGDDRAPFERTLALLPKLHHLCPPLALVHVSIDRFSPYHDEAERYGVTALEPAEAYAEVYPPHADLDALAYHFRASYDSGSKGALSLMHALNDEIRRWHEAWQGDPRTRPALAVNRVGRGQYVLVDTRGLGGPSSMYLGEAQARAALVGGPKHKVGRAGWAIDAGYAADLDGWCVPLAVAPAHLLAELEHRAAPVAQGALQTMSLGR